MPTPMTHAVVGASFSTALPQSIRGFRVHLGLDTDHVFSHVGLGLERPLT
jgi:hypothetical protein